LSGDGGAVLVIVNVPVYVVCAVGVKVTLKLRLWPAFNVVDPVKPLTANGGLVVTPLMVIGVDPTFAAMTLRGLLVVLTTWLPKLIEVGLTFRTVVPATPVPDKETLEGEEGALLAKLRDPE